MPPGKVRRGRARRGRARRGTARRGRAPVQEERASAGPGRGCRGWAAGVVLAVVLAGVGRGGVVLAGVVLAGGAVPGWSGPEGWRRGGVPGRGGVDGLTGRARDGLGRGLAHVPAAHGHPGPAELPEHRQEQAERQQQEDPGEDGDGRGGRFAGDVRAGRVHRVGGRHRGQQHQRGQPGVGALPPARGPQRQHRGAGHHQHRVEDDREDPGRAGRYPGGQRDLVDPAVGEHERGRSQHDYPGDRGDERDQAERGVGVMPPGAVRSGIAVHRGYFVLPAVMLCDSRRRPGTGNRRAPRHHRGVAASSARTHRGPGCGRPPGPAPGRAISIVCVLRPRSPAPVLSSACAVQPVLPNAAAVSRLSLLSNVKGDDIAYDAWTGDIRGNPRYPACCKPGRTRAIPAVRGRRAARRETRAAGTPSGLPPGPGASCHRRPERSATRDLGHVPEGGGCVPPRAGPPGQGA